MYIFSCKLSSNIMGWKLGHIVNTQNQRFRSNCIFRLHMGPVRLVGSKFWNQAFQQIWGHCDCTQCSSTFVFEYWIPGTHMYSVLMPFLLLVLTHFIAGTHTFMSRCWVQLSIVMSWMKLTPFLNGLWWYNTLTLIYGHDKGIFCSKCLICLLF